jgi:hypothetical protein
MPVQSVDRQQTKSWQSLRVEQDVVFVMSQEMVRALTDAEKKELLLVLHENPKVRIFIPDGLNESDAITQSRIEKLVREFPGQIVFSDAQAIRLKNIPVVFLGNMEGRSAQDQLAVFAPKLARRVTLCYGYRRASAGKNEVSISFGVPLLAAVGNIAKDALKKENGFLYDPDSRFSELIRSELRAHTIISTSA